MARQAKGPRSILRGNSYWGEWADGFGGKIRRRLYSVGGFQLRRGDSEEEITFATNQVYHDWLCISGTASKTRQEAIPTIGELTAHFAISNAADWSDRTRCSYHRYMELIERYFGIFTCCNAVTVTSADSFKGWLSEHGKKDGSGLSSRSVNNVLYFARNIFQFAQNREWVTKNVFDLVRPRKAVPVRHPDPFTPDEVRALLKTAKDNSSMEWFFPVVLFLSLTGCRRGAVPLMVVSDFDALRKLFRLRADAAKRGRAYEYAIPEILSNALEKITTGRSGHEPLFVDDTGKGISGKAFDPPSKDCKDVPASRTWYRLLSLANVRPRGAHNLRRAVVTNLAEADVTMDKIIAVTGQTIDVARQLYLRLDKQTQRETMHTLAEIYDHVTNTDDSVTCRGFPSTQKE